MSGCWREPKTRRLRRDLAAATADHQEDPKTPGLPPLDEPIRDSWAERPRRRTRTQKTTHRHKPPHKDTL